MSLIDGEKFRKKFFELDVEFRPSQIDAVFDCLGASELVDAEPVKHGRWLKDPHPQFGCQTHIYMMWKCSVCNHSVEGDTPYCPWCGARMRRRCKNETEVEENEL